jgi:hypothetical protein
MEPFGLPTSPNFDVTVFGGNSVAAGQNWHTWIKPPGKSRLTIIVFGGGGGGGAGAIGAASTAAGGGGGGSGGMTIVDIPLSFIPARLYISVGNAKTGNGIASYVSTQPNTVANHTLAVANPGSGGGNATGASAGSAGVGAGAVPASVMPLGWPFSKLVLGGQAGIIGGTTVNAANISMPTTGLRTLGGTGGGGLAAAATTGRNGGSVNVSVNIPTAFYFPIGGVGSAVDTVPPGNGVHGVRLNTVSEYFFYGGTGGASTHGSATGTGLVQSVGGNGAIGAGGGGSGGALSGSTPSGVSLGGSGMVVLTCS